MNNNQKIEELTNQMKAIYDPERDRLTCLDKLSEEQRDEYIRLSNERLVLMNFYTAIVTNTHGLVNIEGTIIFVLATIAEQEKRSGYVSTIHSPELEIALKVAAQRRDNLAQLQESEEQLPVLKD